MRKRMCRALELQHQQEDLREKKASRQETHVKRRKTQDLGKVSRVKRCPQGIYDPAGKPWHVRRRDEAEESPVAVTRRPRKIQTVLTELRGRRKQN